MPVEATAEDMAGGIAALGGGTLSEAMLTLGTLLSALAVDVITILLGACAETGAMQLAHIIGTAAVTGQDVTGEAVTRIRPTGILEWAITAWAMATRTTAVAITVTATGIIRTTEIGDIIPTSTDSGRPSPSASGTKVTCVSLEVTCQTTL